MYVVLYLPTDNDPEVFGPFPTAQRAAHIVRQLSAAAGTPMNLGGEGALATIDVLIDNERNRYQLIKLGSSQQLDIHAEIIAEEAKAGHVRVETARPRHLEKGAGLLGG